MLILSFFCKYNALWAVLLQAMRGDRNRIFCQNVKLKKIWEVWKLFLRNWRKFEIFYPNEESCCQTFQSRRRIILPNSLLGPSLNNVAWRMCMLYRCDNLKKVNWSKLFWRSLILKWLIIWTPLLNLIVTHNFLLTKEPHPTTETLVFGCNFQDIVRTIISIYEQKVRSKRHNLIFLVTI